MGTDMKPLLFAAADTLNIDLTIKDNKLSGSRKDFLDLFEGYSPMISSTIEDSLVDHHNDVVAVKLHIFGNIGAILVIEAKVSHVSLFLYDRSKEVMGSDPWSLNSWSRKQLYAWLEPACKAIYERPLYDIDWEPLSQGTQRLAAYNSDRNNRGLTARKAYDAMWCSS